MQKKKLWLSQTIGKLPGERRGLDGELLTAEDIQQHKKLLKQCGLPVTIGDPVPRKELEKAYPHLKRTAAELEVRRIVDKTTKQRSKS